MFVCVQVACENCRKVSMNADKSEVVEQGTVSAGADTEHYGVEEAEQCGVEHTEQYEVGEQEAETGAGEDAEYDDDDDDDDDEGGQFEVQDEDDEAASDAGGDGDVGGAKNDEKKDDTAAMLVVDELNNDGTQSASDNGENYNYNEGI